MENGLLERTGVEIDRRFVRISCGQRLAYAEAGAGHPVVLIHGTLTTLEDMTIGLSGELSRRHRVIAFDRPGCGRSETSPMGSTGIARQARQLLAAIGELGLERPVLVGHSLGASVALAMASDAPDEIAGVVALAPLVVVEPRLEQALFGVRGLPFAGSLVGRVAEATSDQALLPALWQAMFLPQAMPDIFAATFPFALAGRAEATTQVGQDALAAGPGLMRTFARALTCMVPTSIVGGDRDLVVRNGVHGRMLAALMPNAEYVDMPGLGHMVHHFAAARLAAIAEGLTGSLPDPGVGDRHRRR